MLLIYYSIFKTCSVLLGISCKIPWAKHQPNLFFKNVVGNKVESADKHVSSVLQEADLYHIMAAVFASWGSTVAAAYTIALFDQNP